LSIDYCPTPFSAHALNRSRDHTDTYCTALRSYIINIIAVVVIFILALFGNGAYESVDIIGLAPSAGSSGVEPYEDGRTNFITATFILLFPCCIVGVVYLCTNETVRSFLQFFSSFH
jgi:hypothetical protein